MPGKKRATVDAKVEQLVSDAKTFMQWAETPQLDKRFNVTIGRRLLWQIILAQVNWFHVLYTHQIRLHVSGDGDIKKNDKDLLSHTTARWLQHANHPMAKGVVSPLGTDPSSIFILFK